MRITFTNTLGLIQLINAKKRTTNYKITNSRTYRSESGDRTELNLTCSNRCIILGQNSNKYIENVNTEVTSKFID
jgi:hypothetical protein